MDPLLQARLESAGRAVILGCGAIAAALGHHLSDATTAAIAEGFGGFLVLLSVGLSQWNVYRMDQAVKEREARALNTGIVLANRVTGATPLVPAEDAQKVIAIVAPSLPDVIANPLSGH
jgi:hypothetical protein